MILGEHKHLGIGLAFPPNSYYWTVDFGNSADPYLNLTVGVIGSGNTDPFPGIHSFIYGLDVYVAADADVGWIFDHWKLDGVEVEINPSYSFVMDANHTIIAVFTPLMELSAGWNMVSFPCLPDDVSFSTIFADVGFYQVLTWDGSGYVTPSVAEAGVGYWILVLEETTVTIENANPVTSYTKSLPPGWSMIGSIYQETVDASTVFPGFYQLLTWDGSGYVTSTTIEPGKGYWALVLETTTIVVGE